MPHISSVPSHTPVTLPDVRATDAQTAPAATPTKASAPPSEPLSKQALAAARRRALRKLDHDIDAPGTGTQINAVARQVATHPTASSHFGLKQAALLGFMALAVVRSASADTQALRPGPVLDGPGGLAPANWHGIADAELAASRDDAPAPLRYMGEALPPGAPSIYKPDSHRLLGGNLPDIEQLKPYMHPHYLEALNTKALGHDIMAHRGLMDLHKGILENSKASIDNAYQAGFRTLELDVRVTRDGVPILFHDCTLGRMTHDPDNRLVSDVDWRDLENEKLVIRDPITGDFTETEEKILRLEDQLDEIKRTKPDMSVVLDSKDSAPEAVFDLLLRRPDLRSFVAIKPHAVGYVGGFDQFLGNIFERHGIDPKAESDQGKRADILAALKQMKVVPAFAQDVMLNPQLQEAFPSGGHESGSVEALAEAAMGWVQSWKAMDVKIVEAQPVPMNEGKEESAMQALNHMLGEESNGLSMVALQGLYRSEDFSIQQPDGSYHYFNWILWGEMANVTDNPLAARRGSAGAYRKEGDSSLTDTPNEEAVALMEDKTLARGHTGMELNVPPGTPVDLTRNKGITELRKQEHMAKQKPLDMNRLHDVRAGRPTIDAEPPADDAAWSPEAKIAIALGMTVAAGYALRNPTRQVFRHVMSGPAGQALARGVGAASQLTYEQYQQMRTRFGQAASRAVSDPEAIPLRDTHLA